MKRDGKGGAEDVQREAQTLSELPPHPNVVRFFGSSQVDGRPALVLEFCDAGSLSQSLHDRTADWPSSRQVEIIFNFFS